MTWLSLAPFYSSLKILHVKYNPSTVGNKSLKQYGKLQHNNKSLKINYHVMQKYIFKWIVYNDVKKQQNLFKLIR